MGRFEIKTANCVNGETTMKRMFHNREVRKRHGTGTKVVYVKYSSGFNVNNGNGRMSPNVTRQGLITTFQLVIF